MPDSAPLLPITHRALQLPNFRAFVGVEVIVKALPTEVLESIRASTSEFSLRLMSKIIDPCWAGHAKSPEQLAERFKAPDVAFAGEVPIRLDISFQELSSWQLDPRVAVLALYPRSVSDLPIVEHSLGHFGAAVVDFKIYVDDILTAVKSLQKLGAALGEIVAIVPIAALPQFEADGVPVGVNDASRSAPVLLVGEIATIFAREALSAEERFAADNEAAAWCEATDYLSLSPRLELKTRYTRRSGLAYTVAMTHYRVLQRWNLYRRVANRVRAAGSAFEVIAQRWSNDLEYFRWKHFRSGRRR